MSIDIVNLIDINAGIIQCHLYTTCCTFSTRSWSSKVISIGSETITTDFTINFSTAFYRWFILFQDNNTSTLTHDKTIAIFIKGTTCRGRIIIASRKSFHNTEPWNPKWCYGWLCTTSDHRIGITTFDHMVSITNRMCSRCTSGYGRKIGPFCSVTDRYLSRSEIDDQHWNKERRYTLIAAFIQHIMIFFNGW